MVGAEAGGVMVGQTAAETRAVGAAARVERRWAESVQPAESDESLEDAGALVDAAIASDCADCAVGRTLGCPGAAGSWARIEAAAVGTEVGSGLSPGETAAVPAVPVGPAVDAAAAADTGSNSGAEMCDLELEGAVGRCPIGRLARPGVERPGTRLDSAEAGLAVSSSGNVAAAVVVVAAAAGLVAVVRGCSADLPRLVSDNYPLCSL